MSVRRITHRGEKRWQIDFYYTDFAGVRTRFRKFADVQNRESANAEYIRLARLAAETGRIGPAEVVKDEPEPEVTTFGTFWAGTFKSSFLPSYRPATRERYVALHRQWLSAHFDALPLSAIDVPKMRAFVAVLAAAKVHPKGPCNLVKSVLRAAAESQVLTDVPRFPRMWKDSKKVPTTYDPQEIEALLEGTEHPMRTIIALGCITGMRIGEIMAAEVRDLDLNRGRFLIRRAFSADVVLSPKSGNERWAPLPPRLVELLRPAVEGRASDARLIPPTTRQQCWTRLRAAQNRLGLPHRSLHQLRHFFCTTLLAHGVSPEAVRQYAGHADLSMTTRYAHSSTSDADKAVLAWGTSVPRNTTMG